MDCFILPFSEKPYQIMYLPVSPEGRAFQAKVELRFLEGAGLWFLSISDAVTGVSYVNKIPLICSYEDHRVPFLPEGGGRPGIGEPRQGEPEGVPGALGRQVGGMKKSEWDRSHSEKCQSSISSANVFS